jgi:hypothetical protein
MKRALVLLALLAGVAHAQFDVDEESALSGFDVGSAFGETTGASVGPAFELDLGRQGSGPSELDGALTMGGVAATLMIECEAEGVVGTDWNCVDGNGAAIVLSEASTGTSPTIEVEERFTVDEEISVSQAGKVFQAADTSVAASGGNMDLIMEAVVRFEPTVATGAIITKFAGSTGYGMNVSGTQAQCFAYSQAGITDTWRVSSGSVPGAVEHVFCAYDFSATAWRVHQNGAGPGSAIANNALLDVADAAHKLTVHSYSDFATKAPAGRGVLSFRIWKCDGCVNSTDADNAALERSTKVDGLWPVRAAGQARPLFKSRASASYTDYLDDDGVTRWLAPVGFNGLRGARRKEVAGGEQGDVYLGELASTNSVLQSQTLQTTWTTGSATISTDGKRAPNNTVTMDGIVGLAAAGGHRAIQSVTLSSTNWTMSAWCEAGNMPSVLIHEAVGGKGACFNLDTGTQIGNFNGTSGQWLHFENWGDHDGNGENTYRVGMSWAATAAATTLSIYASDDPDSCGVTDHEFTGDAATVNTWCWGVEVEALPVMTSYQETTTAPSTRVIDSLVFSDTLHANPNMHTMEVDSLCPVFTFSGQAQLIGVGATANGVWCGWTSNNRQCVLTNTSVAHGSVVGGAHQRTGEFTKTRVIWDAVSMNMYADGVEVGTPDTSIVVPASTVNLSMGAFGAGASYCGARSFKHWPGRRVLP